MQLSHQSVCRKFLFLLTFSLFEASRVFFFKHGKRNWIRRWKIKHGGDRGAVMQALCNLQHRCPGCSCQIEVYNWTQPHFETFANCSRGLWLWPNELPRPVVLTQHIVIKRRSICPTHTGSGSWRRKIAGSLSSLPATALVRQLRADFQMACPLNPPLPIPLAAGHRYGLG